MIKKQFPPLFFCLILINGLANSSESTEEFRMVMDRVVPSAGSSSALQFREIRGAVLTFEYSQSMSLEPVLSEDLSTIFVESGITFLLPNTSETNPSGKQGDFWIFQ